MITLIVVLKNVIFPSEKPNPPRVIPHGLDPKDVWLSDGSLLVLRGGTTEVRMYQDLKWKTIETLNP